MTQHSLIALGQPIFLNPSQSGLRASAGGATASTQRSQRITGQVDTGFSAHPHIQLSFAERHSTLTSERDAHKNQALHVVDELWLSPMKMLY